MGGQLAPDGVLDELPEAVVLEAPGVGRQDDLDAVGVGVDVQAVVAGRVGADRQQRIARVARAQQQVLDEVQAFAAVVADEVAHQLGDGGVHRLAAVVVADAARQHLAAGIDDVEVVPPVARHEALVAGRLLGPFDGQHHLGPRGLGRGVAGGR